MTAKINFSFLSYFDQKFYYGFMKIKESSVAELLNRINGCSDD